VSKEIKNGALDTLFSATPSVEKEIVDELFSDANLDRKTELSKPIQWSVMKVLREFLDQHTLPYSSGILMEFVDTSFRFLISHKRKGRQEYVQALKAITTSQEINRETNIQELR
jgi:hypothetical protein